MPVNWPETTAGSDESGRSDGQCSTGIADMRGELISLLLNSLY
jgi:hypothetical protein